MFRTTFTRRTFGVHPQPEPWCGPSTVRNGNLFYADLGADQTAIDVHRIIEIVSASIKQNDVKLTLHSESVVGRPPLEKQKHVARL